MSGSPDPGEIEGRRERKKRETRAALASAALRLAAELGPDGVTIEQIAAAADVSNRTFFNYFASKEQAIVHWDPDRPATMRARLEARPADEPVIDALAAVYVETATSDETAADWVTRMALVRSHPSLYPSYVAMTALVERELVEVVAERTGLDPSTEVYPTLVVACAVTTARVAVHQWQATDRARPLADMMTQAFSQLAHGMAGVPELR